MLGVFGEPVSLSNELLMKEVTIIAAMTYRGSSDPARPGSAKSREFVDAARILADRPDLADTIITHRFPLDGAAEAFETAGDRLSGAITVAFLP